MIPPRNDVQQGGFAMNGLLIVVWRRQAGETLTDMARSYGVDHSMISRLVARHRTMPSHIDLVAAE
jgi:hypothetical protein